MICQCGATIPDNVEYCPYCGKRQFIRTRPAQLTNNPVEPFRGDFSGVGGPTSCGGWLLYLLMLGILIALGVALWHAIGWSPEQIAQWLGLT